MERKQRLTLLILTLFGILLCVELTHIFIKVNFTPEAGASFCSVSQLIDCDGVAKTSYSMFLGIPLSLWGMFLYLIIIFLTFVDKIQARFKNTIFDVFKNPSSYIATLGLVSFICSILLASISIFKINKICYLCFITYFIDLAIAIFTKSKGSFFTIDIKNTAVDFIEGAKKYTALFIVVVLLGSGLLYYFNSSLVLSPIAKNQKNFKAFVEMEKNPYTISGNTLGNPKAEIKVYAYSDFMCPYCRVSNTMVHKLVKDLKNIEVIHQNYPLDRSCNPYIGKDIHPGACELARYALAAKQQGNYWGLNSAFYDYHPKNANEALVIAQKIGLNPKKLAQDANSDEIARELQGQIEMAHVNHVNGTPATMVSDIVYFGAMPYDELVEKIKQAEKRYRRDHK